MGLQKPILLWDANLDAILATSIRWLKTSIIEFDKELLTELQNDLLIHYLLPILAEASDYKSRVGIHDHSRNNALQSAHLSAEAVWKSIVE